LAEMMEESIDGAAYIRGQLDLKMVTGRYSSLLVGQLKRCVEDRLANILPILDDIGGLEGARLTRPTRTKEPTQFTRVILDGLWHKHYVQARFIPQNVQNHWRSNKF
jgi:hypothetical protein